MGARDTNDSPTSRGALLGRDLRARPDAQLSQTANDEVVAWCAYNVGDDGASAGLEFTQLSAIP